MVYAISTAGNWLFCNRRWLDPLKRDERERLEHNYNKLCTAFPVFARCSKAKFIQSLMDVNIAWSDRLGATPRKKGSLPSRRAQLPKPKTTSAQLPSSRQMAAESYRDMAQGTPSCRPEVCAGGLPGDRCHAIDACSTGACSGEASPYDSGDDAVAAELNAGEAVDMKLFRHWTTSEAGLLVDAGELEQFGRSKSF